MSYDSVDFEGSYDGERTLASNDAPREHVATCRYHPGWTEGLSFCLDNLTFDGIVVRVA